MAALAPTDLRDFQSLYRTHYGFVWHALRRFGANPWEVEDGVQDVFVVAYRRRSAFAGSSVKAWLYGIARRVASNRRRSATRRGRRRKALEPLPQTELPRPDLDAIHELDRYLQGLSDDDRELFILSELEGLSGPEIAQIRRRKVQTVYTRIRKLRLELQSDVLELDRVRRHRPQASAQGWVALVPWLDVGGGVTVAGPAGAPAWGAKLLLVGGLSTAAAAGAGIAVVQARSDRPAPTPNSVARAVAAPAASRSPAPAAPSDPVVGPVSVEAPAPTSAPPLQSGAPLDAGRTEAAPPTTDAPGRSAPPSPVPDENALLALATGALRDDAPRQALVLTSEHARRFPDSPFRDLSRALRIEALCRLGKTAQARGERTLFLRDHPRSPALARVRQSCATPQENASAPDTTTP